MVKEAEDEIRTLIADELAAPCARGVVAAAEAIREQKPRGIDAILFYGACLRDDEVFDRLIDFYVIVDDFGVFYSNPMARVGNRLIPPNVYYFEKDVEGRRVRVKYAVLNWLQFDHQMSAAAWHSTLWGRLSQPFRLVYGRDAATQKRIERAAISAVSTFFSATVPLMPSEFSGHDLWTRGLAESYGTEFRAERKGRHEQLYQSDKQRYDSLTLCLARGDANLKVGAHGTFQSTYSGRALRSEQWSWLMRRIAGRTLQILRLAKAVFTFTDGLEYILHKIEKHSGQTVEVTAWQRRHPILAAPNLAWRLYRKGGFR